MKQVNLNEIGELPYAVEEALNRLRINVGFCGSEYKKIMVISSMPNEGKSFITTHLWRLFAEAGIRSCLIDADMRKSVMSEKYGINWKDGDKGLSDYLSSEVAIDDILFQTNIENGCMVPNINNVINPSILLENGRFEFLLDSLEKGFGHIFVDCPPLNLVSDGERIGSFCDGAILVIRSADTPKELVRNSVRQLERSGCPLLGIVLNRVKDAGTGYYSKRYGTYYGKYYGKYGKEYYYS